MKKKNFNLSFRPSNYCELRSMEIEHVVAIFDSLSPKSSGGVQFSDPSFWLTEIHRKDQEMINRSMLRLTRWVTAMTIVVAAATVIMLWLNFSRA